MSKTGIPLELIGQDGNAFSILGRAKRAMRLADQVDLFEEYHEEATSGDYDNLLRVTMEWFTCDDDIQEVELIYCIECGEPTDDLYCQVCSEEEE